MNVAAQPPAAATRTATHNVDDATTRGRLGAQLIARRLVGVLALCAAVMVTAWLAQLASAQRVQQVRVDGDFVHLSNSEVERAVGSLVNVPMLELDVERIHAAAAALPWVRRVGVHRQWPHGVLLTIEERKPVALWNADRLLDADGNVFDPALDTGRLPPSLAALPRLFGPNGREAEVLARLREFDAQLHEAGLGHATELRTNERRSWIAQLESGMRLRLGRIHSAQEGPEGQRIAAQLRVLGRLLSGTDAEVISADLRYSNGFALRFAEPRPITVADATLNQRASSTTTRAAGDTQ